MEAIPLQNNAESREFAGAFINCWVNTEVKKTAEINAVKYVKSEGWKVINIEEIFIAERKRYLDEPTSLKCFDQAVKYGAAAIFYTWPVRGKNK
jgi:hypothetical protein